MDSGEYFERVVRFLETKGWNTSTTRVNESIFIVTGTRKSETYYDRMMTMVGVDSETTFDDEHLEYLVDAADEHDVDQLLATCRGGVEEGAADLLGEYGIEFIDSATIDDAFIDEFQIESAGGVFEGAPGDGLAGIESERFTTSAGSLLALYLLAAAVFGAEIALLGLLSGSGDPLPAVLAGGLVLVGPLLGFVGALALVGNGDAPPDLAGIFLGSFLGYLLFVMLVGASGGVANATAATVLFASPRGILALFALAVPTAVGAVAAAYAYVSFGTAAES
jgi:hypothetical protein